MYHLLVYGPNGFFREFKGNGDDPPINILFGMNMIRVIQKNTPVISK